MKKTLPLIVTIVTFCFLVLAGCSLIDPGLAAGSNGRERILPA